MNERIFYSLSSNCLIRSHLFQQKKSNRDLQFINRFRKMHLYNAIHSVSKQKINKSKQLNKKQFSAKDLFLSENKNKKQFIQGIMQQTNKSQNKFVKLKHLNVQKRAQTFKKLPLDNRSMRISNDKKSTKNQLIIKAQKVNKNKPQRLSLRLSTTTQKECKNQLCLNEMQKCMNNKWQTGRNEEHLFDDARFRRSIQSPSVCEREKQQLITQAKQMRKTQVIERNQVKIQKRPFNLINRISLHDQINQSHQSQKLFSHHSRFVENLRERFSVTTLKTHPNLFVDNNNQCLKFHNGSLQKLTTLKQQEKQNIQITNDKKIKLKPAYIQKFLKTTQAKDIKKKQSMTQTKNTCQSHTKQYHSQNFQHMNLIEILHPEGEFSTHFEDQFNPW